MPLTAISASPFALMYQKASPCGTAENVGARPSERPAQPRHRIAVMVDVHNFGEVVGPAALCRLVGCGLCQLTDGVANGEPRRDWRK